MSESKSLSRKVAEAESTILADGEMVYRAEGIRVAVSEGEGRADTRRHKGPFAYLTVELFSEAYAHKVEIGLDPEHAARLGAALIAMSKVP